MKKIFLTIAFFAVVAVQAQIRVKPAVRAGINFSKFTNSDTDMKTDFFVGGSVALNFTKFYALQPELSYSRQGAKETLYANYSYGDPFDPIFSTRKEEYKYSLDYLSLTIINKFTFGPGFQVMVGPAVDFKIADNFASYGIENPSDIDVSLVAGVGFAFKNGLGVDLRFKQGLVDIFGYRNTTYYTDTYYEDNYTVDDVVLNQTIQLGVSYTFDTK